MSTIVESDAPRELSKANLQPRSGSVFPSPKDWREQIFYFLLPDRFSDGQEDSRPLFDRNDRTQFKYSDKKDWMVSGRKFQGGKIKGITSKIDYLKELGVTTLWIGPIWRQQPALDTYHGYGIQNFLDVDLRLGTRQDIRDLVDAAHEKGIYVILDVIYNHTGNNWFYRQNGDKADMLSYRFQPSYPFYGWRSHHDSVNTVSKIDEGVWPKEFQDVEWYHRAGKIDKWDPDPWEDPMHPDNQFRRGDFFDLKDLKLERDDVLDAVIKVYEYWIALTDCDGFRIDTVKHVSWETSRNFCGAIHEYAESIGKDNFLLLGEVTGGTTMSRNYLEIFGRNIDSVLDIGTPANNLAEMVKGFKDPSQYFNQYVGHDILGTHRQTGRYHVSILDDHDLVGRKKARFSAGNHTPNATHQAAHAVGVQLTTLGIPCIYYGTEQAFDGSVDLADPSLDGGFEDRFIREAMFGGSFGAFETEGCHFFDTKHPTYLRISAIARIRNGKHPLDQSSPGRKGFYGRTLCKGRQYLRETSTSSHRFLVPRGGELVPWSRVLHDQELVIVLNTNAVQSNNAEITVDAKLNAQGSEMKFLYRSDWSDEQLASPPGNQSVTVNHTDGRARIHIDLVGVRAGNLKLGEVLIGIRLLAECEDRRQTDRHNNNDRFHPFSSRYVRLSTS